MNHKDYYPTSNHMDMTHFYPPQMPRDSAGTLNGYYPLSPRHVANGSRDRRKARESSLNVPRTVDITGEGNELTVRGHIDLLRYLPVHHEMHRKLLDTFRKKPGNYEGKYNDDEENKATTTNLGNGYLSIHFKDDISQPELSEFLVSKGWIPLAVSNKGSQVHEKWTNMVTDTNKHLVNAPKHMAPIIPERYY